MATRAFQATAGPRAHFLLGHARQIHADPLGFLAAAARDYGNVVPLRLGPIPLLLVNEPSIIEEVLVKRNRSFVKGLSLQRLKPALGRGLLTNEGESWLRQRRLIQPVFHHERIATYGRVMVHATQRMLDGWRTGDVRDVQSDVMQLTLGIVTECLLGADAASHAAPFADALNEAMRAAYARLNSIFVVLPDSVPNPQVWRLRCSSRRLHRLLSEIIATRRAHSDGARDDLLSVLLQARDADDGRGMPEHQLIDEVMTLVLAGHETTAIVLTWAWCLLAGHPSAEALLQAELDEVLGGRLPTVSDLPRLRFTRMVVLETLRLFPPSWLLERQAIQPVEVAGRRLRKGTTVMMSQWVMHRDPRFFEQPDQFQPGRWADGLEQRLPRFAYFPFGGGPRICIGSGFAMQEAMLVLATINQRYSMTLTPGQTVEPWPTVTLRPRTGVQMEVRLRAPAQPAPALG